MIFLRSDSLFFFFFFFVTHFCSWHQGLYYPELGTSSPPRILIIVYIKYNKRWGRVVEGGGGASYLPLLPSRSQPLSHSLLRSIACICLSLHGGVVVMDWINCFMTRVSNGGMVRVVVIRPSLVSLLHLLYLKRARLSLYTIKLGARKKEKKNYSTRGSQMVTHSSTNLAI